VIVSGPGAEAAALHDTAEIDPERNTRERSLDLRLLGMIECVDVVAACFEWREESRKRLSLISHQ
jgi:hypothetical protein